MTVTDLKKMLTAGRHAHLIGIGGVSMFPLAELLKVRGLVITGSDAHKSPNVEHLLEQGFHVTIGHFAENVQGADLVIRTAAVHDEQPGDRKPPALPVFRSLSGHRRGAPSCMDYRNALCISGTHGKTTTTSMCTHIVMAAHSDPTVMIGGTLPLLGAGHRVGHGDTIILESCEYCNSFLSFCPTIAVILNIEADHLDFFKDLEDVEHSFRAFADLVPEGGRHHRQRADDRNTMDTLAGEDRDPVTTFGLGSEGDVHCRKSGLGTRVCPPSTSYQRRGARVYPCRPCRAPGLHNVKNALAAAAAALYMGVAPEFFFSSRPKKDKQEPPASGSTGGGGFAEL